MRFNDTFISRSECFSLGIEQDSGRHYLSIPISQPRVDYEAFYRLSAQEYQLFLNDAAACGDFLARCQAGECEARRIKP